MRTTITDYSSLSPETRRKLEKLHRALGFCIESEYMTVVDPVRVDSMLANAEEMISELAKSRWKP